LNREAIAYCEKMVLDLNDIEQAHDEAIQATQAKFANTFHGIGCDGQGPVFDHRPEPHHLLKNLHYNLHN
jgi:hypothetical protein